MTTLRHTDLAVQSSPPAPDCRLSPPSGRGSGPAQTPMMPLHCTAVTSTEGVLGLRDEWRGLSEVSVLTHPFVTWEWASAWYRAYDDAGDIICLCVRGEGGTLVAVVPLFAPHRGVGEVPSGEICFVGTCGRAWNYYAECMVAPGLEWGAVAAVLGCLRQRERPWHALRCLRADPRGGTIAALAALAPAEGFRVLIKSGVRTSVGPLPDRPEDVLDRLQSAYLRRQCRRDSRHLHADWPKAAYRLVSERDDLVAVLAQMRLLSLRQWQDSPRGSNFVDDRFCAYLAGALENFRRSGTLQMLVLETEGRLLAAQASVLHRGCLHLLQPAADPAYSRYSLGQLVQLQALQQGVTAGARSCDLGAYYPHKTRWAPGIRQTLDVTVLPESWRGTWSSAVELGTRALRLAGRKLLRRPPRAKATDG